MPLILPQKRGLIVHTTTGIHPLRSHVGHQFYEPIKVAINRLSFCMAQDCQPYGIAVIALSLGDEKLFMRTWELDPNEEESPDAPYHTFSPAYVGRAVVALATDENVLRKAGPIPYLEVPALAREYGFTDKNGRQP
jgi:NAD(P)-dependent dehydrogenase (short-subunit alcohol dehydrogenase family)